MAEPLFVGALCLTHLGFALLALSMERHWDARAIGRPNPSVRSLQRMRHLAWLLLAAAYVLCVLQAGVSMGSVLWCMLLPAGALSVALLLTWHPAWLYGYIKFFSSIRNRQDQ
jgi:hypothetical protein